jgi:hypothetical protein
VQVKLVVRAFGVAALLAIAALAFHCREGAPTGDPKTPPNSPLPEIDQRERDPRGPATPSLFDAG